VGAEDDVATGKEEAAIDGEVGRERRVAFAGEHTEGVTEVLEWWVRIMRWCVAGW